MTFNIIEKTGGGFTSVMYQTVTRRTTIFWLCWKWMDV